MFERRRSFAQGPRRGGVGACWAARRRPRKRRRALFLAEQTKHWSNPATRAPSAGARRILNHEMLYVMISPAALSPLDRCGSGARALAPARGPRRTRGRPAPRRPSIFSSRGCSTSPVGFPSPREKPAGSTLPASMARHQTTSPDSLARVALVSLGLPPGRQVGLPVSDLFPHMRKRPDIGCLPAARHVFDHAPACTCAVRSQFPGRPSLGAWATTGLGTDRTPGFLREPTAR